MNAKQRQIEIQYPDLEITLTADLLEEKNPELCDLMWRNLPIETIQSHTMSTGEAMYCPHRIVDFVKSQTELITEMPVGSVCMSIIDYKSFSIYYGKRTEPLPNSPVARIRSEDLESLRKVGKKAWEANYLTHFPLRVVFRRKES